MMQEEFTGHVARRLDNREARAVERSIFGPQTTVRSASAAYERRPAISTPVDLSAIDAYFAEKAKEARRPPFGAAPSPSEQGGKAPVKQA